MANHSSSADCPVVNCLPKTGRKAQVGRTETNPGEMKRMAIAWVGPSLKAEASIRVLELSLAIDSSRAATSGWTLTARGEQAECSSVRWTEVEMKEPCAPVVCYHRSTVKSSSGPADFGRSTTRNAMVGWNPTKRSGWAEWSSLCRKGVDTTEPCATAACFHHSDVWWSYWFGLACFARSGSKSPNVVADSDRKAALNSRVGLSCQACSRGAGRINSGAAVDFFGQKAESSYQNRGWSCWVAYSVSQKQ